MIINSIILAGGLGSRLQPVSTPDMPKQFHDFFDNGTTLLQDTVQRALEFSKLHKITTIGNVHHHKLLGKQLRAIDYRLTNKILFEPIPKNTAASVYMAAKIIKKGVMAIVPSDHYIAGDFKRAVMHAAKIAATGKIVTFGIKPDSPNINYGYILGDKFLEKPNAKKAEELIAKGALWNSGIFVARAEDLLEEFAKFAPEFFDASFTQMPRLPFDKSIMEKTDKLVCLEAGFEWDDLGSWESLQKFGVKKPEMEPA